MIWLSIFSSGPSFGVEEHEDVISAAQFFKKKAGLKQIIVIGTSQGASSAILAAAKNKEDIHLVVAENPYASIQQMFRDVITGAATHRPKFSEGSGIANYIAREFGKVLKITCVIAFFSNWKSCFFFLVYSSNFD